jgi:hypothetical protein
MYKHKHFAKRVLALMILCLPAKLALAENIDPCDDGSQYAYGENVGWVNFEPNVAGPNVGATVTDSNVTGFVWAENIGWINLDPNDADPNTGVTNDGTGELSGLAWGENVGWINFDPNVAGNPNHYGVTIDANGDFDGWAWGENIGWIHFQSASPVTYKVQTSWTGSSPTCWDPTECAGQPSGDATCDGFVNLADLFALKADFGKSAPWTANECCADFTQDGSINLGDLFALKAGFGTSGYNPSTANQNCPP